MPVPPLPEGISARLREAIDPRTGRCKHHPNVQLCELIQNGSRWAVRRKICYKCGSRNGSSGGKHHRPGIAVKHPDAELQAERRGQRRASSAEPAGGRRRSGSGSALAGSSSRDLTRSRGHSASRRNMSNMSSACLERSNHRMMRSMHNIGGGGTGGNINRSGSGGGDDDGPLPRRTASQSMHDITAGTDFSRPSGTDAGAPSRHHSSTSSFHGRALEFTSKAMAESGGAIVVHPSPLAEPAVHESALAEETEAEFDESDPVIMVPLIVGDGGAEMPPPPPRTAEELERHKERLELRRAHIRREREERRKRRTSATNKVTSVRSGEGRSSRASGESSGPSDPREERGGNKSGRRRSASKSQDPPGTPDPAPRRTTARSTPTALVKRERSGRTARALSRSAPSSEPPDFPITGGVVPSSAAMALLLGGSAGKDDGEKDEDRPARRKSEAARGEGRAGSGAKRAQKKGSTRRSSKTRADKTDKTSPHVGFDDDGNGSVESETSSISSASAKLYEPPRSRSAGRNAMHGVELSSTGVPKTLTVDRSRSMSRSRSRLKARDADGAGGAGGRRSKSVTPAAVSARGTSADRRKSLSSRAGRSDAKSRSTSFREIKKRSGEKKVSVVESTAGSGGRDRSRDKGSATRADRSSSRGRNKRAQSFHAGARSTSVRSRGARSEGVGKSAAVKKSSSSSRATGGTQPESLSSDEYLRRNKSRDGGDNGRADEPEPVVIRKKRAHRKSAARSSARDDGHRPECDATAASEYTKPMTTVAVSEDERSRCSSVSSNSSAEESYYSYAATEDDDGRTTDEDFNRTMKSADVRDRAARAIRVAKSGAKVTKGAFDLKGKGRKWQSALFM